MAHHGISRDAQNARNATVEIYSLIKPNYALLPVDKSSTAASRLNYLVNKYLAGIVRKIYVSANGDMLFNLPYTE